MPNPAPDGVASTTRTAFSRSTRTAQHIDADADTVWRLLITARVPAVEFDGRVAGRPDRSRLEDQARLDTRSRTHVLAEGQGVRAEHAPAVRLCDVHSHVLLSGEGTGTRVVIIEHIGSPFYPFVARMIPPLEENFEQFTTDLNKAAEAAAARGTTATEGAAEETLSGAQLC